MVRLASMSLLLGLVWLMGLEPFDRLAVLSRLVRPAQLAHLALLRLEFGEDIHTRFHSQGNPRLPKRYSELEQPR